MVTQTCRVHIGDSAQEPWGRAKRFVVNPNQGGADFIKHVATRPGSSVLSCVLFLFIHCFLLSNLFFPPNEISRTLNA